MYNITPVLTYSGDYSLERIQRICWEHFKTFITVNPPALSRIGFLHVYYCEELICLSVEMVSATFAKSLQLLLLFTFLFSQANSCSRRRRSCYARNCAVSYWSSWSWCSHSCGSYGTQSRTRYKTQYESCGGSCYYNLRETRACNRRCCPVACSVSSWSRWSSCLGCGWSTQTSFRRILAYATCRGRGCPNDLRKYQNCYTGR